MAALKSSGTIRSLTATLVTGPGVTTVEIQLPDGPGFYELRRFVEMRTTGAAAATKTTSLNASAGTATSLTALAESAAATPVGTPTSYRPDSTGRAFYTSDGKLLMTVTPNVTGDTFTGSLVVVRIAGRPV